MDEPMHATPTADMELEQRLDAYARARLSLAPDAAARIRARVMGDAHLALGSTANSRGLTAVEARSVSHTNGWNRARLRRGGALLLAAGLAVGVLGGTAAAAQPGGPLYAPRIWVEQVTLPADPSQRAAAELRRLESRISEIETAARIGDQGGVAAAVAAYGDIADEALGDAGSDPSLLDLLRLALDRHLAVLQAVAATAPAEAQAAIERNIERAVERNDATLLRIGSRTSPTNGNQGGGSNTQPGVNQGPEATHAPAATPDTTKKPHPSAKPTPTPDPAPAIKTPAPAPTPGDHQGGGKPPPKPTPGNGNGPSN
jgi:hypothetical protein